MRKNRFVIHTVIAMLVSFLLVASLSAAAAPETAAAIQSERPAVEVMFVLDTSW